MTIQTYLNAITHRLHSGISREHAVNEDIHRRPGGLDPRAGAQRGGDPIARQRHKFRQPRFRRMRVIIQTMEFNRDKQDEQDT